MKTKKGVIALFRKLEKENPTVPSYRIFFSVRLHFGLTGIEKERAFLELVDPDDYAMDKDDYLECRKDPEFKKLYPTLESYNDEMMAFCMR